MDLRRVYLILRQRALLFFSLAALVLAAVVLSPQLAGQTMFASTSKILLTPPTRINTAIDTSGRLDQSNWLADENTLKELLTSERLLQRVLQAAHSRLTWMELRERTETVSLSPPYSGRVTLFSITIQDESPAASKKMSEVFLQQFQSYVEELSAREFISSRRFLDELVAEAQEKVESTESRLLAITSKHNDIKDTESVRNIGELESERRRIREEAAVLASEVDAMQSYLSGQTRSAPWSILEKGDSTLSQLENAVSQSQLKLVELEQKYNAGNVRVQEQRQQLTKYQQMKDSQLRTFVESSSQQKSRLLAEKRQRLSSVEASLSELRNRELSAQQKREVTKLERELAMWEDNHLTLVKQLYQARVSEQSSRRQGAMTVLESPSPGVPALRDANKRNMGKLLAFALPFSIGVSLVAVLGLEQLGQSMRILPRVEQVLGVPVLAVVPTLDVELAAAWEVFKRGDYRVPDRAAAPQRGETS